MSSHRLFRRTRLQLACWYAGVMGLTVLTGGLTFYYCLTAVETRWFNRTVEDLAGTLHDYLQPKLGQAGQVRPEILDVVSGMGAHQTNLLGITRQRDYYIRLTDLKGRTLALSNFQPVGLPTSPPGQRWRILTAANGTRYRQIDDYLHNRTGQTWGYLQLGRSMAEFDSHLQNLRLFLVLSIPGAMLLVGASGWWLAGLAMRPIYRSYQQMEQFTADAAHELRTPLATTRTLVQTALSKAHAGKWISPETLEAMERQNDRTNRLVADLLLLSRTDRMTAPQVSAQVCCLNDLICDLQEELAQAAQVAGVELGVDIPNAPPVYVLGNEEQLYRLLANLMNNGIQYTPAGGKVTVYLKQTHSSVMVQVIDTGIGIPAEAQTHIFDRFYRVDAARSRHTGGAGLGLSIAKVIAQVHGGSIQVQSQLDKGSSFTVTLPRFTPSTGTSA